ncbi:ferredoxin reductase [Aeromicrobium sp. A1-2]|uniref:NAD(P)/FAD-dependent oxidoreductase n=1 Tax=Aeromicrobium sp. A1-2 TaxID=2107713 RepID=UPI000E4EF22A|nr:FAD-dependent oxidoreductase [Aeromicrobium sp. A1-2]AXT86146.1 ferredoxin reductase [Aeromicrobium sp. A1-2]
MEIDGSIVVIGAGLAAAKAVESVRAEGFTGRITLIGDEAERPYERPALSKGHLQGSESSEELYVHPPGWLDEHDVTTMFGDAAASIERDARTVTSSSGVVVPYDRLLIATGASPRRLDLPGADLDGVLSLRTIADSSRLREAFTSARDVVIIGGGWIGLETAAAARAAGARVTVCEFAAVPLGRVLGDELGGYFADLHRSHGVDVRTSVSVTALIGSAGRVSGVQVGDEVLPADVVVVAVGISPNTQLAEAAGLEVDGGICVDAHLRTSDPVIFAAGDVAMAFNTALGRTVRVEHWDNAIRQGVLAGRALLDKDGTYDWQPYFFTDQYDLGMEYVGRASADDAVVIRGDLASGEFIAFWLAQDVVRAGMNVNVWDVNDALRALVGRAVDRERLADPGVPLTEVTR